MPKLLLLEGILLPGESKLSLKLGFFFRSDNRLDNSLGVPSLELIVLANGVDVVEDGAVEDGAVEEFTLDVAKVSPPVVEVDDATPVVPNSGCSRSGVLATAVSRLSDASSEVGDIAADGGDSDEIGGLPNGNALVFNFIPRLWDSDGFFCIFICGLKFGDCAGFRLGLDIWP